MKAQPWQQAWQNLVDAIALASEPARQRLHGALDELAASSDDDDYSWDWEVHRARALLREPFVPSLCTQVLQDDLVLVLNEATAGDRHWVRRLRPLLFDLQRSWVSAVYDDLPDVATSHADRLLSSETEPDSHQLLALLALATTQRRQRHHVRLRQRAVRWDEVYVAYLDDIGERDCSQREQLLDFLRGDREHDPELIRFGQSLTGVAYWALSDPRAIARHELLIDSGMYAAHVDVWARVGLDARVPTFLLDAPWSMLLLDEQNNMSVSYAIEHDLVCAGKCFDARVVWVRDDGSRKAIPLEQGGLTEVLTHEMGHFAEHQWADAGHRPPPTDEDPDEYWLWEGVIEAASVYVRAGQRCPACTGRSYANRVAAVNGLADALGRPALALEMITGASKPVLAEACGECAERVLRAAVATARSRPLPYNQQSPEATVLRAEVAEAVRAIMT